MQTTTHVSRLPVERSRIDAPHLRWYVDRSDRAKLCASIVAIAGPTLIRTRSQVSAAALVELLRRRGVPALHYGGPDDHGAAKRARAAFNDGRVPVVVSAGGRSDLRLLASRSLRCLVYYDPVDSRPVRTRSARVAVTLVVPDHVRELGDDVTLEPPDLERLRALIEPEPSSKSLPQAVRGHLVRLPALAHSVRGRFARHRAAR